jgi:hypothetical protein
MFVALGVGSKEARFNAADELCWRCLQADYFPRVLLTLDQATNVGASRRLAESQEEKWSSARLTHERS